MTKIKEDISRVRLEIDGKQAINQLGKLEMESKEIQQNLKNLKKGTKEYIAETERLNTVTANIKKLRAEIGLAGMTMTQLRRHQKELMSELNNTVTYGTKKYRELEIEIQRVNAAIRQQQASLNGTKGFFAGLGKEIKQFGVLAIGFLGIGAFIAGIQRKQMYISKRM
jgi:chromosome segregation ATPase